ncbi:MAG: iron ABC transporter permease [Planctomycetes bacterium]|nr:iron ABC transporter permease [Planctomycetota bacterium]
MNRLIFFVLIILAILSSVIALRVGSGAISWQEFWQALFNPSESSAAQMILWMHRLPRILAALLIGAGLSVSGCVLQGLLRNPLAEPYTLGISGGAALGATAGILIIPGFLGAWSLPFAAFAGAALVSALVYMIAGQHRFSVIGLVLAGVILSFISSSLVLLIFSLINPIEINSILFWLIGNLSSLRPEMLHVIPFFITIGIILLYLFGRELDAMSLGDEKAFHLGVNTITVRKWLFIITSLVVGGCIATAGMIGFVGLIIPHLMRLIIGPKHRPLIVASALAGAAFLVICDTIARTLLSSYGQELPVGVVTGIIGGMFFLLFLMKRKLNYQ